MPSFTPAMGTRRKVFCGVAHRNGLEARVISTLEKVGSTCLLEEMGENMKRKKHLKYSLYI